MGDEPVEHDPGGREPARRRGLATWNDAILRRPALDPAIPPGPRDLLLTRSDVLLPAGQERPRSRRSLLPAQPERRQATVSDAAAGLTTALFVGTMGATPWAFGVLVFQQPLAWQSAVGRYGLLLAALIAAATAVVFGARILRYGELCAGDEAVSAATAYRGRYLTGADLDARARILLRRAQDAVHTASKAEIVRSDLLDQPVTSATLAEQEWQIALALREQSRLRALRAGLAQPAPGSPAAELLDHHRQAARAAEQSTADRIAALEKYAAEVVRADAAYRDWRQRAAVAELTGPHLDLLARTAADAHGIAELNALADQARALRHSFTEPQD
ncbi:MAG TPA: hypothetical protein VHZ33_34790 [Trebonia sp.]|jgi:hypothetical protein|nr:hypothetical protein [Trebonia sp.]